MPARVMVVEDDDMIRQLITVNLEIEGFEVIGATDGREALARVKEVHPTVVTLDVMMPHLDGWETASRLRSDPETADIKLVLLSARAQQADRRRRLLDHALRSRRADRNSASPRRHGVVIAVRRATYGRLIR
jgi:CheY-like chemotaxis protein